MDISPTIQHLHGRIHSITGTDPAAGAEISETVPARRRWRLFAIRFLFTTEVAEANRQILLKITDGTNEIFRYLCTNTQAASLARVYTFSDFSTPETLISTTLNTPIPPLVLTENFVISTATLNIQAGDDFSDFQLLVEEWIDP